jgi:ferritin-like protein
MDGDRAGGLSRRELITGAVAVGATAALVVPAARADTPPESDPTLLSKALVLERLSVLAYTALIPLPALSAHERRVLRTLVHQDRAHVRALEAEMTARGIALPPAPTGPAALDQTLSAKGMSAALAGTKTLKQTVQLLLDIEALTQGGYYMIIRDASDPALALRGAQVLANEAQHSTLLTELVSPEITQTVPGWYVTGVT